MPEDGGIVPVIGAGAPVVVVCFYRYNYGKPRAIREALQRAGFYPWHPAKRAVSDKAGIPEKQPQREKQDILDVERWRLRVAQEQDEDCEPYITYLERGEHQVRRIRGVKQYELVRRGIQDYHMVNGLLHRKFTNENETH